MSLELGIQSTVHYIHKAIKNVLREGLEGKYDFIYSAGLFDYFSDPVARMAGIKLQRAVDQGGELVIGNFTAAARSPVIMEMALDWNLIYRTDLDLRRLYDGIAPYIRIESEPEGINLFAVLSK